MITIREATPTDVATIVQLVRDLAEFEKSPESAVGTVESFTQCMFPTSGEANTWALVAEIDGTVVGMAVWFKTFSTWTGTNGVHLEDLYVVPEHRGKGVATALIKSLAAKCVERGYPRLEWVCLKWNDNALSLYRTLGATELDEWTSLRVDGAALARLAASTQS